MAVYDTAKNVINDAALELGLITSAVSDPYASSVNAVSRLAAYLKALGRDLARSYNWPQLHALHQFDTEDGTASYDLPSNFGRMVDQTQWDRTEQMPLPGPASPQQWQVLKSSSIGGTIHTLFRLFENKVYLHPTPTGVATMAFEYVSSCWVATGTDTPSLDAPTDKDHVLWFDPRLLVCGLKLRWLRGAGFDTTTAQQDYDEALALAKGADPGPVLSLNARTHSPLLGNPTIPETGFGS